MKQMVAGSAHVNEQSSRATFERLHAFLWWVIEKKLYPVYWWLERHIDPGTKTSQHCYAGILDSCIQDDSEWLDLGCGHAILPDWIADRDSIVKRARRIVGIDCDWASLTKHRQISELATGDSVSLPFRDSVFNRVSANMVVEHLVDPVRTLGEVHRVLRPGGLFVYHTPNVRYYMTWVAARLPQWFKNKMVWLLERRSEADIFPAHYRMNRLSTIGEMAEQCRFHVVQCESLNTSAAGNILLGPFVIIELLIRRLLRRERFREFRSNFIVVLEKV